MSNCSLFIAAGPVGFNLSLLQKPRSPSGCEAERAVFDATFFSLISVKRKPQWHLVVILCLLPQNMLVSEHLSFGSRFRNTWSVVFDVLLKRLNWSELILSPWNMQEGISESGVKHHCLNSSGGNDVSVATCPTSLWRLQKTFHL